MRAGSSSTRGGKLDRSLAILHSIVAFASAGGAWYAIDGARAVPREWLDGSPFDSYLLPGLVLGIVVGGSQLVAAILEWSQAPSRRTLSLAASAVLATWIVVQVAIIGFVSFLQPLMLAVAALCALLARPERAG